MRALATLLGNRRTRYIVWLLAIPALLVPIAVATAHPLVPVMLGVLVVLVLWWGTGETISPSDGALCGAAAAVAGPALWVVFNLLFFVFVYGWTASNACINGATRLPGGQDILPFLRSEFATAFRTRLLPTISPGALLRVLWLAIPSAIGGALAALLTGSAFARSGALRQLLDMFFLARTEREADDFERTARDHPRLVERTRELIMRGFDENEARSIALAEFRDPVLNPPVSRDGKPRP